MDFIRIVTCLFFTTRNTNMATMRKFNVVVAPVPLLQGDVSHPFLHGGNSKIIIHIPKNSNLLKHLQTRKHRSSW